MKGSASTKTIHPQGDTALSISRSENTNKGLKRALP